MLLEAALIYHFALAGANGRDPRWIAPAETGLIFNGPPGLLHRRSRDQHARASLAVDGVRAEDDGLFTDRNKH